MLYDVEQIAEYAMEMGYYASAIELSRAIFEILPRYMLKEDSEVELPFRMEKMRKKLVSLNNKHLEKSKALFDKGVSILPYMIDNNLKKKKKKQPDYVRNGSIVELKTNKNGKMDDLQRFAEWSFVKACRNGSWSEHQVKSNERLKCQFLHHQNAYLKLGPFKEDQRIVSNLYVVVFRDLLSEHDISLLIKESQPKLSSQRSFKANGGAMSIHDLKSGNHRRIIHKLVQTWLEDVKWPTLKVAEDYVGKNFSKLISLPLWKLNRRISLATQLVTDTQTAGTLMQVTNYGLGGLCEQHLDPHGLMESDDTYYRKERPQLFVHGDIFGTFMAWLSNIEEGGATVYLHPDIEGTLMPQRGSAAFWYNLNSDGYRNPYTAHGGCPVLKGSKWILNKWLYWYDNFKKFPCNLTKGSAHTGLGDEKT